MQKSSRRTLMKIAGEDFREYESMHLKHYSPHKYARGEYTYSSSNFLVRWLFWYRLNRVLEHLKDSKRGTVIDIGCGEGALLLTLAQIFDQCVGVDVNVEAAKKLMDDQRIRNVSLIQEDFAETAFEEDHFDLVTATDVLEHIPDLSGFSKKIRRILSPDGLFLITIPSENLFYAIGRKFFGFSQQEDSCPHLYNAKQIMNILEGEFEILEKEFIPFNLPSLLSAFHLVKMKKRQE
jgi:2-polyprenyl-3-methyl-5-hydroxy-6-metoxy-1,4-benzoquinol methylase